MLFQPRCPVDRQGHRQQDTMYHKKKKKKRKLKPHQTLIITITLISMRKNNKMKEIWYSCSCIAVGKYM